MSAYASNQAATAVGRLPAQSQNSVKIVALVTALAQPFQDVEDLAWAVLTERGIDTGVGVQLDAIGKVVGQARGGLDDADYRRYLAGAVARNKSRGTINELINIAQLVLGDPSIVVTLVNSGPGAAVMTLSGDALTDATAAILSTYFTSRAVAAGVRLIVEYSDAVPASTDTWDTGTWDTGLVWATALDH